MDKFPIDSGLVAWSTIVQQSWAVIEEKTASGKRRTLVQQSYPAWTFSLKFPALDKEQIKQVFDFQAKMRGSWGSFLYKDYENHHVENAELMQQGDAYYCRTDLNTLYEPCHYVENLHVFVDGVETKAYKEENGIITLTAINGEDVDGKVTATYDYYYLVSFGKNIRVTQVFDNIYTLDIELEVVRE